jgi:hypothetical protein
MDARMMTALGDGRSAIAVRRRLAGGLMRLVRAPRAPAQSALRRRVGGLAISRPGHALFLPPTARSSLPTGSGEAGIR